MAHKVSMTQAEAFAMGWGNDGHVWYDENDEWIVYVLSKLDTNHEFGRASNFGLSRFIFTDGSAIVISAKIWHVEGDRPFETKDGEKLTPEPISTSNLLRYEPE